MTQQRLSKLQRWILQTTLTKGQLINPPDILQGLFVIPRKTLAGCWLRENYKDTWTQDDMRRARTKLEVSLTRSIVNLHRKGLVRTFKIERPAFFLWLLRPDFRSAKSERPLKKLSGADTSQEDQIIEQYESLRQASREGKVNLIEIKEESPRKGVIQLIALPARSSCAS
jgi:hypothetical protein